MFEDFPLLALVHGLFCVTSNWELRFAQSLYAFCLLVQCFLGGFKSCILSSAIGSVALPTLIMKRFYGQENKFSVDNG